MARARTYSIGDLRITEPPELDAIRKALTAHYKGVSPFGFMVEATARGGIRFVMSARGDTGIAEIEYPVLPLFATDYLNFWLALEAQFQTRLGETAFKNVSLLIFGGELVADKQPILRAEWEAVDGVVHHAQPHWHVYGSAIATQVRYINSILSELEPSTAPAAPVDPARIHFAMMAQWVSPLPHEASIYTAPTATALQVWVAQCLRYVTHQLQYVCRTHGV